MGNILGGVKFTKVMKIDGQTFKLRTPVRAAAVLKDYPGFSLLESEAVKHYGARAKPLEPQQELKARRLYFLVQLPKPLEEAKVPRRARSGINMSAKDRLESLLLARRSVSDLSILKPKSLVLEEDGAGGEGVRRVRMTLPKAEVAKVMEESKDEAEAAEKIVGLYVENNSGGGCGGAGPGAALPSGLDGVLQAQKTHWKRRERRVGFHPIMEGGEIQVAVA